MSGERAEVSVLGHTRWASVGIISEANAHPVNSEELEMSGGADTGPYVVGVLNGDVDNHADLKAATSLRIAGPITTDAKVIPALVARNCATTGADRDGVVEAFRRAVAGFDGSVAIGAASAACPGTVMLALRGSGQGVYIGIAEDRYIVASEPYGIVEETDRYVRLDGEQGGELVALDGAAAGTLAGIARYRYDGTPTPVTEDDLSVAEVTTRDIDRGDAAHFLLKEISESPESLAKTLRGQDRRRRWSSHGRSSEIGPCRRRSPHGWRPGRSSRIKVIGQGTAAVAGRAVALTLGELLDDVAVEATVATELSGFGLQLDMSDTLAIAVSQSGTTTDTNRTVDLLKARGAAVLAIVNRRSSDLTDKADGVLYTSDGRDVEMSVASTKAFYAQVAAGTLLACAISEAAGVGRRAAPPRTAHLVALPARGDARSPCPATGDRRGGAPVRTDEALLGSRRQRRQQGRRRRAADQAQRAVLQGDRLRRHRGQEAHRPVVGAVDLRLCGRAVGIDSRRRRQGGGDLPRPQGDADRRRRRRRRQVPRRRHDLGAADRPGPGVRAVDDGRAPVRLRGGAGDRRLGAPATRGPRGDRAGRRRRRAAPTRCSPVCAPRSAAPPTQYVDGLRNARYDGHLEASTAVRLAGLLRDVRSEHPVEEYQLESGKVGSPAALLEDLVAALTQAIEELTRPVDAIKHQAKTVTVGISRSDEGVIDRPLVQAVLAAGAGRDVLSYKTLKVLADLDPAVAEVVGFTRYGLDGDTITVVDRGGLSMGLASRVERRPVLSGTKRSVASQREVLVARGRSDGRTVIFVPEVKANVATGHHVAARALPRPPRRRHDARRAAGLRPPLRPPRRLGQRDRGQLRRAPARRPPRRRPAHRADLGTADHWRS